MSEWQCQQSNLISKYCKKVKTIGGDARMDSLGHTAKYGSYSIMDLDTEKVISVQTLQVSSFQVQIGAITFPVKEMSMAQIRQTSKGHLRGTN